ncbi:poly-beta-1,6 N-acetyl-D-glucosamine export porin PgaA [Oxalobacteraceae bacterium CAVE-383]|nr:poly-beta-1,6 N-acetyl-D-glucosamine export porin PgaA [Oxalobacteraceae bacterium CAVE-383]
MKNKMPIMLAMLLAALADSASSAALAETAGSARDGMMPSAAPAGAEPAAAVPPIEGAPLPLPPAAPLPGAVGPGQEDLIATLNGYDRTLARFPQSVPAREGRLLALSQLGLPSQALAEAEQYPQVDEAVLQHLHEDEAALTIRQAETTYYKPGDDYAEYDKAILLTQENLKRYPDSARSRFDMVRALNDRKRHGDAVAIYESLEKDGIAMPAYVYEAAGDAYLAEQKPERSAQAYRVALETNPNSSRANIGLFYALLDQSDYDGAQRQIDAYAAKPLEPAAKFDAATSAIFERAYENRLDVAQRQLLALQDEAPASDQLHLALGKIYLWRGWPRLAREEYGIAEQRDPENPAAQAGLIEVEVALGDYQSAAERLSPMLQTIPDDGDVKKLAHAGAVRDYNQLEVSASGSRSRENLGNGRGVIVESKLTGAPIGYQTRPFIHEYFERGISNGVSFDYRRLGLGAEHTFAGLGAVQAEVQQEFFRHKKTSVAASGRVALNDYWELRANGDSNALAVPLLARFNGISGWSTGAGASWRASERLALHADYSHLVMSDDNIRREISMRGVATVIQGPVYKGALGLELGAGSNSREDAPYFNPRNAHVAQLSFTSDWLGYQRYSRSFSHQLVLSLGRYTEHGFSTRTIGGASYEARADLSQVLSVSAGVGYVRRVYSGEESSGPEAHIGLNWKFL